MSILVEILQKSRFWSKFATNLGLDKTFENLDFDRNFQKISILVAI